MSSKREKVLAKTGLLQPELVFNVDKNLLDDEWMNQAKLYFKWAEELEAAKAELDEARRAYDVAKAEFELVRAEVDLSIRRNPKDYDDLIPEEAIEKGKLTEKMIESAVVLQLKCKDAQEVLFEAQKTIDVAKHRVGILQAAVDALDHKKKALEKLVDLHGQKYFATPRASEQSREHWDDVQKAATRRKGKKSNK